ncbi:hypothetical protein FGADI_1876 [Fusarium gaditjirri]|uniref:Uncharacterized protein n=1 Tax=Fusarium gaditjirri TaxID=282569 RepID=A0A8H4TJN7_9HYPO|nr:hypothetical protein FGADI_1876 [Fusarium gaditjirri]
MPLATGFIKSLQPTRFIASFDLEGSLYTFTGNTNPPTQPFESNAATLEYDSVDTLRSSRQFNGIIGDGDQVSFTFNDGTVIKGNLDSPISPASSVNGTGSWHQE